MEPEKHIEQYNLTDYKENYNLRLKVFCERFIDAEEYDFLENELYQFKSYLKFSEENEDSIWSKINSENLEELIIARKNIVGSIRSYKKIIELIEKRINELMVSKNNSNTEINNRQPLLKTLKWHGGKLEFTELIKPLIELKKISPQLTQKEIFIRLKMFFEIEDFNENDKLKDIKKRTHTTTPFINILEDTLNNWIKKKD